MTTQRFLATSTALLWLAANSAASGTDLPAGESAPAFAEPDSAAKVQRLEYGNVPLSFEANHGQTDPRVMFLARGRGYTLFLTGDEVVISLHNNGREAGILPADAVCEAVKSKLRCETEEVVLERRHEQPPLSGLGVRPGGNVAKSILRMNLVGSNQSGVIFGEEKLPGKVNYLIGMDPTTWTTAVPTFASVHRRNAYPGVDVVYYGNQGQLEYDIVLEPGVDPKTIILAFEGADRIEVDTQGRLVLNVGGQEVVMKKPLIYQEVDGVRREVPGGYALKGNHRVGFRLSGYDPSLALVIDPVLIYSTFLGGGREDEANGISVDGSGSAYVTGSTHSANFPVTNAVQQAFGGGTIDAFVTKLNPAGTAIVYSTFLGGNGIDLGYDIAVDDSGNAYVAGETRSQNFPTVNPFQAALSGPRSGFVAKLNPAGSGLVYSTYLGGSSLDFAFAIALDPSANAYVIGRTSSSDFPTVNPLQAAYGGNYDAFVTKLNPAGSALAYSTFLGGSAPEYPHGIGVDGSGNALVAGGTSSANFPTVNPLQAVLNGDNDAFVAKLDAKGSSLIYSTYLGGSDGDEAWDLAADSDGRAYVAGITSSPDFPTANPLQPALIGLSSSFVAKFDPAGSALVYSTFLGGSGSEMGEAVTADASGNAYVTGRTNSIDFPTVDALQPAFGGGGSDAFVLQLNATGSALTYSTYLGGSAIDVGRGIAVDGSGNSYVCGGTRSRDFPTVNALQSTLGGPYDGFVAKIGPLAPQARSIGVGASIDVETIAPMSVRREKVFSAKFLCGEIQAAEDDLAAGSPLAPGSYRTAINIHNVTESRVNLLKQAVLANPQTEKRGPISQRAEDILEAGQALEVDCDDIMSLFEKTSPPVSFPKFAKGFVKIRVPESRAGDVLNVVGVYTLKNIEQVVAGER